MSRRIVTAIDVGSSKVTTVIAAVEEEDQKPIVIGVYSQNSVGIKKGVIVNIEEATNTISESVTSAERMAGVTVSDVYITINGEQITSINNKGVVAVAADNEITIDDTYRAIENAKTISLPQNINPIHIIPREFVVDSQRGIKYPIGMTGMRLEVETHIITAPMSAWQNLVKCIQQIGLTVNDIVFTGWASSLSVLTDTEKELGVTLLDIGAGTTSIAVYQEGAVAYSGSIPLGGISITSDIAIGLQTSLEDAEKIKLNMERILSDKVSLKSANEDRTPALLKKNEDKEKEVKKKNPDIVDISNLGISSKNEISKTMLQQIVEARLEEIIDMAKEVVAKSGYEVSMPSGVVLTGGTAQMYNINKMSQSLLGVPVRIGYPSGLGGMVEEISTPAYSAVQGLVKHALEDNIEISSHGKKNDKVFGGFSEIVSKITNWIKSLKP